MSAKLANLEKYFINKCFLYLNQINFNYKSDDAFDLIKNMFVVVLIKNYGVKHDDIRYLMFDLVVDDIGDWIEFKPLNIITALWFNGLIPKNCDSVYKTNKCYYNGLEYSFDYETNVLVSNIK